MKDCQDYFASSIHLILSNTMFSKLNGTLKNQKLKSLWKSASYTHQHALPPGVRPSPACRQSPVGRTAGVQLPPLARAFVFTSRAGGPSAGGSSPAPEGEDGQEAGQPAPRWWQGDDVAAPPPPARGGSRLPPVWGKRVSGQASLRGCHPAALPSNSPPYSQADRAEIFVAALGRAAWLPVSVWRCGATTSSFHTYPIQGTLQRAVHPSTQTSHPVTDLAHARSPFLRRQRALPSAPRSAKGCYCCRDFFGFAFDSLD